MKFFKTIPVFLSFFAAAVSFAAGADFDALYKKAESALASKNTRRADFYVARYLGLAAKEPASGHGRADVEKLYAARPPEPAAFISSAYDPGFLDWYENALVPLWGQPDDRVRERYGSVELRTVRNGKHFVSVVAYPKVEAWFTAGEAAESRRLLMTLGSAAKGTRVTVIAGEFVEGRGAVSLAPVEINGQNHALQYVWEPFFEDIDGDGKPEIWLRYDLTWGNGFTQFLDVYRIGEARLERVRRFEGPSEGVARRTGPGRVETARGTGTKGGLSHFEYDTHHFENWEFKNGDFVRAGEKDVPHLLRSSAWKEYFADTPSPKAS